MAQPLSQHQTNPKTRVRKEMDQWGQSLGKLVTAVAHLHLRSELPTPRGPWTGLRKPGAGGLSLAPRLRHPLMAAMECPWMNLLKTLFKWSCGICTLLRAPAPVIYKCRTKAGSRIPRWKRPHQSPLHATGAHRGPQYDWSPNRCQWVHLKPPP